jgi:hypothetical protein
MKNREAANGSFLIPMIELKRETLMVSQNIKSMADTKLFSPLAIEAIQVCANIMCDRSVSMPLGFEGNIVINY